MKQAIQKHELAFESCPLGQVGMFVRDKPLRSRLSKHLSFFGHESRALIAYKLLGDQPGRPFCFPFKAAQLPDAATKPSEEVLHAPPTNGFSPRLTSSSGRATTPSRGLVAFLVGRAEKRRVKYRRRGLGSWGFW